MSISSKELCTPTLYKLDSRGAVRTWKAWSTLLDNGHAVETTESGLAKGKKSEISITVIKGKNLGKSNETTPIQQVNGSIANRYRLKSREGYVEDVDDFVQSGSMLALEWRANCHRMPQIALKQPKLDGIRCDCLNANGNFILKSRKGLEFKPFIYETEWAKYLRDNMPDTSEVDGELYIHGAEFNEISSLVGSYKFNTAELLELCQDTPDGLVIHMSKKDILDQVYRGAFYPIQDRNSKAPAFEPEMSAVDLGKNKSWLFPGFSCADIEVLGTSDLQYWIYDYPSIDDSAEIRNIELDNSWNTEEAINVGLISVIAEEFNKDDIIEVNDEYVQQGFEGTIVRNPSSPYAFGRRSAGLLKFKYFFDQEWIIKGHKLDSTGNLVLLFESDTGEEFYCTPKGTRAWKAALLSDIDSVIGKPATIRYQVLHQESLKPQFGRVVTIRDYE